MNAQLKRRLDHLEKTPNPRRQAEIELLHRKALAQAVLAAYRKATE
jgi:hypothetical protein